MARLHYKTGEAAQGKMAGEGELETMTRGGGYWRLILIQSPRKVILDDKVLVIKLGPSSRCASAIQMFMPLT